MKKAIRVAVLILSAVMIILTIPFTASAATHASRGLEFTSNNNGTCYVSGIGSCNAKNIVIPSTSPDGDTVTKIGLMAFSHARNIVSVEIPEGVRTIAEGAFLYCDKLESVEIPSTVTDIQRGVFAFCKNLESITVAEENTKYFSSQNCVIEKSSKTLTVGCKGSVIPTDGSVTVIGEEAFSDCTGLTEITIPKTVKTLENYAFSGCESLLSIHIPASVKSIVGNPFAGCGGLLSITVDEANTAYHSSGNCLIDTRNKILISGCVNSTIPHDGSVTYIGDLAFSNCRNLESIAIPKKVTGIGVMTFSYCYNLSTISFEGTKRQWNNLSKDYNWDIYVGSQSSTEGYEVVFDKCLFEHDQMEITTVAPTCTEDGYTSHKCNTCQYNAKTDVVPATGHDYDETGVCTACGDILIPETTEPETTEPQTTEPEVTEPITQGTDIDELSTEEPTAEETTTEEPTSTEDPSAEAEVTTTKPEEEETTKNTETKAPESTEKVEENTGCGGSVGIAGVALVATLGACTAFVSKKKEN